MKHFEKEKEKKINIQKISLSEYITPTTGHGSFLFMFHQKLLREPSFPSISMAECNWLCTCMNT